MKESKSAYNRNTCTPMFTSALPTIGKLWNQPKFLSTDEWIKKMCEENVVCTHNGILFSLKDE